MNRYAHSCLITGSTGFVGQNVKTYLSHKLKARVSTLDREKLGHADIEHSYSWKDLSAIDWSTIGAVIHLAGMAHDTKNIQTEQAYYDVNVGLTQKIYAAFLESSAELFVYLSSAKAVADTWEGDHGLTESAVPNPHSVYGMSKLAAERYLQSNAAAAGKRLVILRPSMIHGPGNKGNLNLLRKMVLMGVPYPLGSFSNRRSFASIENLLFVLLSIITGNIGSGIYNIADDESLDTREVVKMIGQVESMRVHIWNVPRPLTRIGAQIGDILGIPINSENLDKLTGSYLVSNSKIKHALGIDSLPVTARDGLRRTLISMRMA